jgi:hypothetical protein
VTPTKNAETQGRETETRMCEAKEAMVEPEVKGMKRWERETETEAKT